jgi:hypothetical protein
MVRVFGKVYPLLAYTRASLEREAAIFDRNLRKWKSGSGRVIRARMLASYAELADKRSTRKSCRGLRTTPG